MKKHDITLVSLVLFCLVLVGCSNPYDTIKEQKMKIDELVAKLDKCNLESQEKCAQGAKQAFHNTYYDKEKITSAGYVNHYNKKLNKCFIEITAINLSKNGDYSTSKNLFDVFEGKEYATLSISVPQGKRYSEVKPTTCKMLDNTCTTEEEYKTFVKPYMEE
ncbi:MAG: hypothetical protein ACLP9S_06370 [Syntrophales bacterium]